MVVDQQSLLGDQDRLEELHRSCDSEARLKESFIVLTIGASLGLVADNNAVIIGAIVVAPWILPMQVEGAIATYAVELEKVFFDSPDYWEQNQAPSFQVVRSIDPKLPSYKQVQNV